MFNKIYAHTSFLGHTGYANHSREFFTHLNDRIKVRVRNYAHTPDISYLTEMQRDMILQQRWEQPPWTVGKPDTIRKEDDVLHIVLNETHHYFFYDNYVGPKIAYNVWESTRQPQYYFDKLLEYDQLWVPTEWQRQCSIEQGYPEDRVKVVPEGIDSNIFTPDTYVGNYIKPFTFMIFGRWDYRKSIEEIVRAFTLEFKEEDVELLISADNPFSNDGMGSTEARLERMGVSDSRIKILHFPPFKEYVNHLKLGNCLVTCSRSEGWNIPLIEAIACGTPTICSDFGAQLEFAEGISHKVKIKEMKKPENVFMFEKEEVPGEWSEPDYENLQEVMRYVYENYELCKKRALEGSKKIRKEFTWEKAVDKAMVHIRELYERQPKRVILNLGCGNDIKKGYVNIDRYNNTNGVDVNADVMVLPFKDDSINEVFISHTVEHFSKDDVLRLFKEFNRVLRPNGWLDVRVPDFDVCVQKWTESEDKWGALDHIFGGQTHEGNFHYSGFTRNTLSSLAARHGFSVTSCESKPNPISGDIELVMIARKKNSMEIPKIDCNCHFVNGAFMEIKGEGEHEYRIEFIDKDNNAMVHSTLLKPNHWTKPHRKYFTNWQLKVKGYGEEIFRHDFDARGRRVLIYLDSKSLGDTIAWFPYIEEFRKKHDCHVIATTFWNLFFQRMYPEIEFAPPGTTHDNLYAMYSVGCRDSIHHNKTPWITVPLQQVASDYLGIEYKEIKPLIDIPETGRKIKGKYVCLTEHSTALFKYWNYPNGWQEVVDFLRDSGYKVVVISKEKTKLKGVINKTNRHIKETMSYLKYARCLLVGPSGLGWLAWAMDVPVIMVSGISQDFCEFQTGITRVQNKDVCHGCFNDPRFKFDKGDWNYCPLHKGTPRQFECTKKIYPQMVIDATRNLLNINNKGGENYGYIR